MSATVRDEEPHSEPRKSAPPIMQQPIAQPIEEVVWDESMMELDYEIEELPKVTALEPKAESMDSQSAQFGRARNVRF